MLARDALRRLQHERIQEEIASALRATFAGFIGSSIDSAVGERMAVAAAATLRQFRGVTLAWGRVCVMSRGSDVRVVDGAGADLLEAAGWTRLAEAQA